MVEFAIIAPIIFSILLLAGGVTLFTVRAITFGALASADLQDGARDAQHVYRSGFVFFIHAQTECRVSAGQTVWQAVSSCGGQVSKPITWVEIMMIPAFSQWRFGLRTSDMNLMIGP